MNKSCPLGIIIQKVFIIKLFQILTKFYQILLGLPVNLDEIVSDGHIFNSSSMILRVTFRTHSLCSNFSATFIVSNCTSGKTKNEYFALREKLFAKQRANNDIHRSLLDLARSFTGDKRCFSNNRLHYACYVC